MKILQFTISYVVPIISLIFSGVALIRTRKDKLEEILLKYEIEEKAKQNEPCIKFELEDDKLFVKNTGDNTAYNVNVKFEDNLSDLDILGTDIMPYEFLKPDESFSLIVATGFGHPGKFKAYTYWEDEHKKLFHSTELISF